MLTITPDPDRSIRVPPLTELDFSLSIEETPVVLEGAMSDAVAVRDAFLLRESAVTVRVDAQISVIPIVGSVSPTFKSADESKLTVDGVGKVTTTGTGTANILVSSGTLTRSVSHSARTEGEQVVDTFLSYTNGTLGNSATAFLSGLERAGGLNLFTARNDSAGTYTRASSGWPSNFDFSGVSPYNSRQGRLRGVTLISPIHGICAEHYPLVTGDTVVFVGKGNEVYVRTVSNAEYVGSSTDIRVLLFDQALPDTVSFYEILPENWGDYISINPAECPVVTTNRRQEVFARRWVNVMLNQILHGSADSVFGAYSQNLVEGDSGQPLFLAAPSGLVLMGVHWTAISFRSLATVISAINAAMTTLGGGYQLTTVDLSAYPTF